MTSKSVKFTSEQLSKAKYHAMNLAEHAITAYWMGGRDEICEEMHIKWMLEAYEELKKAIEGGEE